MRHRKAARKKENRSSTKVRRIVTVWKLIIAHFWVLPFQYSLLLFTKISEQNKALFV